MSVALDEPGIRVEADRCTRTVADGPHDLVGPRAYELCLVRDGSFHLRSRNIDVLADSVTALLGAPLEEAEILHPVPGGDATTRVFLSEQVVADLAGGTANIASGARITTPHIDLLHRQLRGCARPASRWRPRPAGARQGSRWPAGRRRRGSRIGTGTAR